MTLEHRSLKGPATRPCKVLGSNQVSLANVGAFERGIVLTTLHVESKVRGEKGMLTLLQLPYKNPFRSKSARPIKPQHHPATA